MEGIDTVFHEAAIPSVPRSIKEPELSHDVNVNGTYNVFLAAQRRGVKRVVYAASSSAYGDTETLPKVETMTPRPKSPYAVQKLLGEYYARTFFEVYGLETVCLRYFNVFGPRQDPEGAYAAVIPKWAAALLRSEAVAINGDGETSRDFCFVANAVQANVLAATTTNAAAVNQVYNVAVGDQTTLNQLYEQLVRSLGAAVPGLRVAAPMYRDFRSGDVRHSRADISKAQNLLGYRPTHRFAEGLSVAAGWYLQHV